MADKFAGYQELLKVGRRWGMLGLYALVFMVALPIGVRRWWYRRSVKLSGDQVLLDTTQMYYYFFHKTQTVMLKRVLMILAASFEFDKKYNYEVIERQSDNEEVPQLIKKIPNLNETNTERPLCFPHSIKARALLHAHLWRIPLNPNTLDKDRQYIVAKCPYLIQEQVKCACQIIDLAYAKRVQHMPTIESIENCMKLCPMIVQALWDWKSPFLQLPHVTDDNLKHFMSEKRQIKSLQQFAELKGEDRRSILRHLSDEEYDNVMKVLGRMPYIDFQVRHEVIDDENPTEVTTGAIVTVTVTLIRKDMSTLFGDETVEDKNIVNESANKKDNLKEWEKFQEKLHKREKIVEGRSKVSHAVHCPYYPQDKQEYWWTYICDRKSRLLLTSPYHVTSLVDRAECQLKFTAPMWKGLYTFTVCLRSDSYIGFDQQKDIKLDVKEDPNQFVESEESDEESPTEDHARESDYTTDEDLPDEDD